VNFCDLTFDSPAENLACDEALLDLSEGGGAGEILRIWEPKSYFVVLGYGNKSASEANIDFCRQSAIPILRRCTGGGAVLQGPGVLNYSLILDARENGPCGSITTTNQCVMQRQQAVLARVTGAKVEIRGYTDLAMGDLKVSGNAQRRKRNFLIFHGSFLLGLDLCVLEKALPLPSHQPDYRVGRTHSDFLMNLQLPSSALKTGLQQSWDASAPLTTLPLSEISRLAREK